MTRIRLASGKTLRLDRPALSDLEGDATCVFASPGTEPRGRTALWDDCLATRPTQCIEVSDSTATSVTASVRGSGEETFSLLDPEALLHLIAAPRAIYLDISGLAHHVWAPMLRAAFACADRVYVAYAEPKDYKKHPSPTSAAEFDLTSTFGGIAPLPGFAKVQGPDEEKDALFVAFLGFEGRRASYVALSLDPIPRAYAVIGVPGFRIEYPQIAHANNREFLGDSGVKAELRYAAASCPFEAYDTLVNIRRDCGDRYMYIAPIGTKPHSLGAICYALKHSSSTEIMYDNPVRKPGRTEGVGRLHLYALKPSYVAP